MTLLKTKCLLFHNSQKKVENPNIVIDNTCVEIVDNFNFLGINIDKHLNFKPHANKIAVKISRSTGILNKLKNQLPLQILTNITLYCMHVE